MKIKSKNHIKEIVSLNFFSVLLILLYYHMYGDFLPWGFYIGLFVILWLYSIISTVAYGKTLLFDENGCTVSFGKYKKIYSWKDFEYIRYYDYSKPKFRSEGLVGGIVFSKKPINLKRMTLNSYYGFHPFSFVYVTFINEKRSQLQTYRDAYTAPKEEFVNKLKEWGVEVQYSNA